MRIANAAVEISSTMAKHDAPGIRRTFNSSRYSVLFVFLALKYFVFFCVPDCFLLCFSQSFPPVLDYSDQSIAEIMKMSHILNVGEVGQESEVYILP